jgi:phosphatidylglycerophosphate synthase
MLSLREVKEFEHRINPTEEIEGRDYFGYYVIRPVSVYFTWLLLNTGFSPNQVTVLHMIVGMVGSVLLGFPDLLVRLVGVFTLYMSFVLDNVDGEVARYRGQVSITGRYLDLIAHTVVIMFMFLGFSFGAYFDSGRIEMIVLGFLAGFFSLRFDVLAMYAEAASVYGTNLDRDYDYYGGLEETLGEEGPAELVHISKRSKNAIKRFIFAIFAFPGNLNVIALVLATEFVLRHLRAETLMGRLSVLTLLLYGVLMPIRRALTLRRIVANHETERQYIKLVRLGSSGELSDSIPSEKSQDV